MWNLHLTNEQYIRCFRLATYAARQIGLSPENAEDVASAAIVRMAQTPTSIRNHEAWISTTARNLAIDLLRSSWSRREIADPSPLRSHVDSHSYDRDAEFRVMAGELVELARVALKPNQLEVFLEVVRSGGTVADAIDYLADTAENLTREAIRKRLYRAVEKLREVASHLDPDDRPEKDQKGGVDD